MTSRELYDGLVDFLTLPRAVQGLLSSLIPYLGLLGVGFRPSLPKLRVTRARSRLGHRMSEQPPQLGEPVSCASKPSVISQPKVIDSAVHVWSDGEPPFPWEGAPPPEALQSSATHEALAQLLRGAAGLAGALIVQPSIHKFDHSYVTAALRAHPELYRGMCLANPTLEPAAAVAELARLHGDGFVGVRFNPYLFPDGMDSPVGHALYKKAGELKMPVGVMCFQGLLPQLPALTALMDASPATTLIVDHFGFFRQPATGGLHGAAAANDEAAWRALLMLAARAQVLDR